MKFDLAAAWVEFDIRPGRDWTESTPWYFEDKECYYRQNHNEIEVAVRRSFDRWANSVDFVLPVPKTRKAMARRLARLKRWIARGHYDPGWGERRRV